ncbi:MAG: HAD family phosphatase [Oscillospiraceae bacterium]|nr:HAD family phosphatase [Oscillospiraceae bacterium]
METLFLSDLDGTLCNEAGTLSRFTRDGLTQLLEQGLAFTVASGRTPLSVRPLLHDLSLRHPMALMNGALVLDPVRWQPLDCTPLSEAAKAELVQAERALNLQGLLLGLEGTALAGTLGDVESTVWEAFFRRNQAWETAAKLPQGGADVWRGSILYGIYADSRPDRLAQLRDRLAGGPFTLDFYQDRYDPKTWCLEVFSHAASKYHAVQTIRKMTGAKWLVGFGDGENDLSFFRACDQCYAVANASAAVRAAADGVIGDHREDGVIRYLERRWHGGL